jgi:hypothetical protein
MPKKPTRTKIIPQHEPKPDQPRPDNKSKLVDPTHNPIQDPTSKPLTQEELEEMEVQGEKKRRREKEVSINKVNSGVIEHFLTAGPGSQDCRDK